MKNAKLMMPMIAVSLMASTALTPVAVMGGVMNEGPIDNEALLKQVSQQLDALNGDVKQTAEDALKQVKQLGDVSNETKAKADQLLTVQNGLVTAVKALTDQLEGVTAKNQEMAQLLAAGGTGGVGAPMSLGEAVMAAGGDQIKAYQGGNLSITVANAITTAAGSAGGVIFHTEERDTVEMARRTLKIIDLISRGSTDTDKVKYTAHTLRTDAAAMVAEGGTYAASAYGWTKQEADVRKIGHITHISEEAMADAAQLQTMVDTELRYGVELKLEGQVLAGDGLGENLSGLIPNATAFGAAAGLPNATHIDRLRLALLQVALADYVADGIVLNPTDWAAIELLKDTTGGFVFGNPGAGNTPKLWGKDVVESNTISAGEWLTGAFKMAATLYMRSDMEVLISSEHGTNFIEDMLTMKARVRATLAVKRPASLITGNFTFI